MWLALSIVATTAFWFTARWCVQLLGRYHLASSGQLAFGIGAICFCFDFAMSMGGGIVGVDRVVVRLACFLNIVAGLTIAIRGAIHWSDDVAQWRDTYWHGTFREVGLRSGRWILRCIVASPLILVFLVVAVFAYDINAMSSIEPANHERVFTQFATLRGQPCHLAIVSRNDAEYIVWIGQMPKTLMPMSGLPCYVFDRAGQLIDYSLDTGDDHHVAEFVDAAWDQPSITLDSAFRFLATNQ